MSVGEDVAKITLRISALLPGHHPGSKAAYLILRIEPYSLMPLIGV